MHMLGGGSVHGSERSLGPITCKVLLQVLHQHVAQELAIPLFCL